MAVAGDAVNYTKQNAEKAGVKDGLQEAGDGKLGELSFGILRDV